MLTTFGKVFTFVMVVFSIIALGVALWAVADPVQVMNPLNRSLQPAYAVKDAVLQNEIKVAREGAAAEQSALQAILPGPGVEGRKMPFNPDDPMGGKGPVTVAELKKQNRELEAELTKLFNDWNGKQTALATLINDLDITRTQVRAALVEQKRLAEIITPDTQKNPGAQSFREQTAAAFAAKQESEKRQEALKPILVNETLRLMSLTKRNELLEKRATELGIKD